MDAAKEKLYIKNHIDHPEKDVETVRLKWGIKETEFTKYKIEENSQVIFTMQDFKSIVQLADGYEASLKIDFCEEGDPIVITVQNEANFETVLVLATLKETDLRISRKPKNITNYRALLGSFIASNKRKSAGDNLNKSVEQIRQNKTIQRKKNGNEEPQLSLPPRAPTYTESELKSLMKSPEISVFNSNTSQSNKRKSCEKTTQGSENGEHIPTPLGSRRSLNENSKKQKTTQNGQETPDPSDLQDPVHPVNAGASTSRHFMNGFTNNLSQKKKKKPSKNVSMDTNDSSEECQMVIQEPEVSEVIPNPNPIFESETPEVVIEPKKTGGSLFQTSSDQRSFNNSHHNSDRSRIRVANQRAKKIFCNLVRTNPLSADDGAEVLVPASDDEEY